MRKFATIFATAGLVVVIDQLVKLWARSALVLNRDYWLFEPVLSLTHIQNTGVGFGLFSGNPMLFFWVGVMFLGALVYFYDRIPARGMIPLYVGLLVGGTLGNMIDRLAFSSVTDFINFHVWPVFNIADMSAFVGVVGLILEEGRKKGRSSAR